MHDEKHDNRKVCKERDDKGKIFNFIVELHYEDWLASLNDWLLILNNTRER